jgi:hypothetical protein
MAVFPDTKVLGNDLLPPIDIFYPSARFSNEVFGVEGQYTNFYDTPLTPLESLNIYGNEKNLETLFGLPAFTTSQRRIVKMRVSNIEMRRSRRFH